MTRLSFTLLLSFSFLDLFGQSQFFLRPLDPGRTSLGLDVLSTSPDEYLFSSLLPSIGLIPGGNLNLTRLRPSGEVLWSKDLLFENQVSHGNLTPWPGKQAYLVSGLTHAADTAAMAYLTKIQDISGLPQWSKKVSLDGAIYLGNGAEAETLLMPGARLVMGMGASTFTSTFAANDLCMIELDTAGNFSFGNKYCFSCTGAFDLTMGNFISTEDGGFLFCGGIQFTDVVVLNRDIFLMKVDSRGVLEWAKGYDLSDTLVSYLDFGTHVVELPNGNFVLVGQTKNLLGGPTRGFVMETDAAGQFIRAKRVSVPTTLTQVLLKHLAAPDDNHIVVQGTTVGQGILPPPPFVENNFLFQIGLADGQIDWQSNFFTENLSDGLSPFDGFSPLPGGYAILSNVVSLPADYYSQLIIADLNGRTGCQTPIEFQVENDVQAVVSDYLPDVIPLNGVSNFSVSAEDFEEYDMDVPVLDLGPVEFFCEPTVKTLDATVAGAESYAWSTGATTPQILAEAPGTFFVEDTSNVLCWILRDTTALLILPPPEVSIFSDTTDFCEFGELTLIANAVGAETIAWSTGANTASIIVSTPGLYTVTGVNMCGTGTASINLVLPDCSADCRLELPNAFSPDGDGTNDLFKPLSNCLEYGEYHFRVYSRWGELVFDSSDPAKGWDGNFKEKTLSSDLFAWILEYRFPEEEEVKLIKGEVTLLR